IERAATKHSRVFIGNKGRVFTINAWLAPRAWSVVPHPILTPFPSISVHVKQSKIVRLQTPHWPCMVVGIAPVPGVIPEHLLGSTVATTRHRARPTGIFPLGLGRQPVAGSGQIVAGQLECLSLPHGCLDLLYLRITHHRLWNPLLLAEPPAILDGFEPGHEKDRAF